ncbi:MAG: hypothetical protein ACNA7Z_00115 [Dethiobacteria bacterium]|nr:hypothetical protein [Bacillota bacterium]MDW7729850.1 hypothetical protein [Bacillota bacterium]
MTKSIKGGILLIIAGVFLLLNQLGVIPGQAFLFLLALGFIATYVLLGARKEYGNVGFLIPGTVLLSIALYASFSEAFGGGGLSPAFFFIGLSISFLAVFLVHTYWYRKMDHGERFWPLYPAAGLLLLAVIISLGSTGQLVERLNLLNYLWIAVLIGLGTWLIVSSVRRNKER